MKPNESHLRALRLRCSSLEGRGRGKINSREVSGHMPGISSLCLRVEALKAGAISPPTSHLPPRPHTRTLRPLNP